MALYGGPLLQLSGEKAVVVHALLVYLQHTQELLTLHLVTKRYVYYWAVVATRKSSVDKCWSWDFVPVAMLERISM
jgi:hypothetical protein